MINYNKIYKFIKLYLNISINYYLETIIILENLSEIYNKLKYYISYFISYISSYKLFFKKYKIIN